jgi:hypothetical protein
MTLMMTRLRDPDAREIEALLKTGRRLQREGYTRDEMLDQLGLDALTWYRFVADYGALGSDQLRRLRKLEVENQRLRRAVSELTLDKLALEEASWSRAHAAPST